jgi:hypothetical protein
MTAVRSGDSVPIEELAGLTAKPHKYQAHRVEVDGIKFASQREASRWIGLCYAAAAGLIKNLRRQVRYELIMVTHYVSDFEYDDVGTGQHVVEDAKGYRTPLYKRKKKLMRQQHGIEIRET